jgi:hypothetical protein
MADATDLKSVGLNRPCRFESGHRQELPNEPKRNMEDKAPYIPIILGTARQGRQSEHVAIFFSMK